MVWNTTNISSATTPYELVKAVDFAIGNIFNLLTLVAIFIIILMILIRNNEPLDSLMVSGWVTFILGFFLSMAQLVSIYYVLIFLFIAGATTLWKIAVKR